MSRLTQGLEASCRIRGYHPLWPAFPNRSAIKLQATGLVRVRSPLLAESLLMSFPPATEMFQFAGFASWTYVFSPGSVRRLGLPHSDIRESTNARFSSRLFAACHVLHRLSVPRHPPNALITLDLSPLTVLTARRDKPCRTNDKPRRHFPSNDMGPCLTSFLVATKPTISRRRPSVHTYPQYQTAIFRSFRIVLDRRLTPIEL